MTSKDKWSNYDADSQETISSEPSSSVHSSSYKYFHQQPRRCHFLFSDACLLIHIIIQLVSRERFYHLSTVTSLQISTDVKLDNHWSIPHFVHKKDTSVATYKFETYLKRNVTKGIRIEPDNVANNEHESEIHMPVNTEPTRRRTNCSVVWQLTLLALDSICALYNLGRFFSTNSNQKENNSIDQFVNVS